MLRIRALIYVKWPPGPVTEGIRDPSLSRAHPNDYVVRAFFFSKRQGKELMKHPEQRQGPLGTDPVARTLQIIAVLAAVVLAIWVVSDILLLIFLAVLIAVILRGVADWGARYTRLGEHAMLAIVSIASTVVLVGFLYYVGPRLVSQSQSLWSEMQQRITTLQQTYGDTAWGHLLLQQLSSNASQSDISGYVSSLASFTVGGLTTLFVLVVTSLYFAISPMLYVDGVVRLFPLRYRSRARHVMLDIGGTLRWWSLGQLVDMIVVGVLSGIGLGLLGVPLALSLGVVAGLFTFVPYFGAIAAAIPAMLVALTIDWQTALWVLVIFLGCHGIEGYVVAPLVQRRTVDLPPALTILSMTVLGTIFGPLGIILGTPVAAVLLVTVREAYVAEVLGDPDVSGLSEG